MTAPAAEPVRVARLADLPPLSYGSHDSIAEGCCILEAAAYVAGEGWTDWPKCVCPAIGRFLRDWSDIQPNSDLDLLLRPLVLLLPDTRASANTEQLRSFLAANWLLREYMPAWLRSAGLTMHADALVALPGLIDKSQILPFALILQAAQQDVSSARNDAERAASNFVWDADGFSGWIASLEVTREWRPALDTLTGTAFSLGRDISQGIAADTLHSITRSLQQSALALVRRMIACTDQVTA